MAARGSQPCMKGQDTRMCGHVKWESLAHFPRKGEPKAIKRTVTSASDQKSMVSSFCAGLWERGTVQAVIKCPLSCASTGSWPDLSLQRDVTQSQLVHGLDLILLKEVQPQG